jgi:hypothetical protein
MVTEYELYADERRPSRENQWLWFGGVVCTDKRSPRLRSRLADIRTHYGMTHEMKWGRVSQYHFDAYCAWVDVFFDDPFARFSLFQIDPTSKEWRAARTRPGRSFEDDRLRKAYYQFWLVTFGRLHDTKRWWVYADTKLFRRDTDLKRVEVAFNRTYKKSAFGRRSSRIVRLSRAEDSKQTELIQLADVLLGALSLSVMGERPHSSGRAGLVDHCAARLDAGPNTQGGHKRLSFERWVPPKQFDYKRHHG